MQELFLECWEKYHVALYKHCFFRLYDQERANDAVQETYLRFWKALEAGTAIEQPRAFLYRIANNHIVDLSRKKYEQSLEDGMEKFFIEEPSIDAEYDRDLFTDFSRAEIEQAIGKLPVDYQVVVYLRFYHDLQPHEIADFVQSKANHISVKLHRAAKLLRQHLKH